jgi:ribosomal protein S7
MNRKKNVYNSFLGFLTKKGNKTSAKILLDAAFLKASRTLDLPTHLLMFSVFSNLSSSVEAKRVRYRRGSHVVPFLTGHKRRIYLAIKWLVESVKEDKRRQSLIEKFSFEIVNVFKNVPCKTLQKKQSNDNLASANKSNIHFRW